MLRRCVASCLVAITLCSVAAVNDFSTIHGVRYCVGLKFSYGRLNMRLTNVWYMFDSAVARVKNVKNRCDAIARVTEFKEVTDTSNARRKKLVDEYYRAALYVEPQLVTIEKRVQRLFSGMLRYCDLPPEKTVYTMRAFLDLKANFLDAHDLVLRAETLARGAEKEAEKAMKQECSSEHFWDMLDEDDGMDDEGKKGELSSGNYTTITSTTERHEE